MMQETKKRRLLVVATIAALLAGVAAVGQEQSVDHRRLESLVGEWDTIVKLWLNGPEREAFQYAGTSTRTWALDGRFVEESATNPTGKDGDYELLSYVGYDDATGVYEQLWLNNASTGMYTESGRYDPAKNTISTAGSYVDPSSGYLVYNRTEIQILGPDTHMVSGYTTPGTGREYKQVEIVYYRKN